MSVKQTKITAKVITITAVFTAMNIILSSFGIPVPGGHFYLNDVIICVAALLLGPLPAFVVGGIGAFIGDMIFYPMPMFVSLVTHGLQAVVISLIFHSRHSSRTEKRAIFAVSVGVVIMIVGYTLGRAFIYSTPEYALLKLPYQILQAAVGAVLSVIIVYQFRVGRLMKTFSR